MAAISQLSERQPSGPKGCSGPEHSRLLWQPGSPIQGDLQSRSSQQKCERSEREKERQSDERRREKRQGSLEEEWKRKNSGRSHEERKHLTSKIPDLPHILKMSSLSFRYISKHANQNKQKRPTATITALPELKPESSIFQTCLLARIGYTPWGTMREINRLLIKPGFPDGLWHLQAFLVLALSIPA